MDWLLKPRKLEADPNAPEAAAEFKYCLRTFKNFLTEIKKLKVKVEQQSPVATNYWLIICLWSVSLHRRCY